jgi:hypothetical protein
MAEQGREQEHPQVLLEKQGTNTRDNAFCFPVLVPQSGRQLIKILLEGVNLL